MTGIYKITCVPTGKIYIGQSTDIETRWKDHVIRLKEGKHDNRYLQNAWNKYGASNFSFTVLEECPRDFGVLNEREVYWIETLNALDHKIGYNIAAGGGNGYSLAGMSDAERQAIYAKLSTTMRNKYRDHHAPSYGRKMTEEQRKKISERLSGEGGFFYGKKRPEHSEKMKGGKNPRARKIVCLTTMTIFDCAKDAEEYANTTNSNILKCCRGVQKYAGRKDGELLVWRFEKGGS